MTPYSGHIKEPLCRLIVNELSHTLDLHFISQHEPGDTPTSVILSNSTKLAHRRQHLQAHLIAPILYFSIVWMSFLLPSDCYLE